MNLAIDIPKRMQHLSIDERGYPIPYFTPIVEGKPDFRYQDRKKRDACANHRLCSICGKKLVKRINWFISGPIGLMNGVHSDAPMHEECARFAIVICPHLAFFKAERRSEGGSDPHQLRGKPDHLFLVMAEQVKFDGTYFFFKAKRYERFNYVDNKLLPA